MTEFYTQNGWKGEKYEQTKDLPLKEIAKMIKKEIKEKYPNLKFSVRSRRFAGGEAIDITIKDFGFNPINPNYNSNKPPIFDNHRYNERARKIMNDIEKIGNQYRFDDCDGMIDYFRVNFWFNVYIDWKYEEKCMKDAGVI